MINTNSNFLNVQPSNYEGFWTPYANTKQTSQNWQHCSVLKTEIWFQNAICKCYQEIVSDSSILVSSSSVSFTEKKMQFLGLMSSSFFLFLQCVPFFFFSLKRVPKCYWKSELHFLEGGGTFISLPFTRLTLHILLFNRLASKVEPYFQGARDLISDE